MSTFWLPAKGATVTISTCVWSEAIANLKRMVFDAVEPSAKVGIVTESAKVEFSFTIEVAPSTSPSELKAATSPAVCS
jgi:hypothetical protein